MPMGRKRTKNLHLPPHMQLKAGSYYYDMGGKPRKWVWLSRDLAEAKMKWAKIENENAPSPTGSFASIVDRYVIEVLPSKGRETQKGYHRGARILKQMYGHMKAINIKPCHVAGMLDQHPSKVAANRLKALMSAMFSEAMRWGWVNTNPCRGVRRNPERPRDRHIEDHEFNLIYTQASALIQCVMDIAYQTGMRKGDILKIRLSDIREDGIYVKQGKTGRQQLFEMTPDLADVVARAKRLRRRIGSFYLFSSRNGQPYSTAGFDSMWQRLKRRVAIENLHFHDIRAKAITETKRLGRNVKDFSGHKTEAQVETYIRNKEIVRVQPLKRKNSRTDVE